MPASPDFLTAFTISFEAIGRLFLVALVGFIAVRRNLVSQQGVDGLVRLMIDLIVPCALSVSMIKGFRLEILSEAWPLILVPAIFLPASAMLSLLYFRLWPGDNPQADRALSALSAIPNSFYIPLPLAIAVTPPEHHVLVGVLIGAAVLAVNPLQWTMGTFMVMGDSARKVATVATSLRQALNGPVIGVVGGVALSFLPGFPEAARAEAGSFMPLRMLLRAMELAGSAMPPLAMILTGALIAKCELRRAISVRRVLPVLAMRFLITPGLVLLAIRGGLLPVSGLPAFILMLVAASPPAMNLALAAKRYDGDWSIISGVQLVASLVALAALPIWMSIGLLL